jgi:Na+/H+-translocating membrane pyrophosphatase
VDSVNQVIALDVARKAARKAQIPAGILFVLYVYSIVSALMLGYVLKGRQGRIAGAFLLALFTLSLALLSDINQPLTGTIRESQAPMERLRETLRASPPALFDRLRPPAAAATPTN